MFSTHISSKQGMCVGAEQFPQRNFIISRFLPISKTARMQSNLQQETLLQILNNLQT